MSFSCLITTPLGAKKSVFTRQFASNLPQRPMNRSIIYAITAYHFKWDFYVFNDFIIYTEIELKEVSTPLAGA